MLDDMTTAYLINKSYSFTPQPCGVQFFQTDSIYTNLPFINVIKSFQQSSHSRFTCDEGNKRSTDRDNMYVKVGKER